MDCNSCASGFSSSSTDPFQDCQPASPPGIQGDGDSMLLYSPQQTVYSEVGSPFHTKPLNQELTEGPSSGAACHQTAGLGPSQRLPYEDVLNAEDWQSLDDLLFSAFDNDVAAEKAVCHNPRMSCSSRESGPLSRGDADDSMTAEEKHDESCRKRHQKLKNRNLTEKETAARRRNGISERIKRLHALIPNSIKNDKASMLDEVVEYMKSLQQYLQNASVGGGSHTNHLAPFAGEAYLVGCPNLSPLMGQGWQNGMLRLSGSGELQQGATSHAAFPSPFPQPFVAGASAMPLIQGALPLWTPPFPQPVAAMNLNRQCLHPSPPTLQIDTPTQSSSGRRRHRSGEGNLSSRLSSRRSSLLHRFNRQPLQALIPYQQSEAARPDYRA